MGAESIAMFQNAAYIVVAILVVMTFYTIFSPMLEGDKLKKRMDSVSSARDTMRVNRLEQLNKDAGLRSESKGFIKDMVDKLSLEKLLEASDLRDKLAQAGMRGQKPIYTFYIFRLVLPIAGLLVGLILFVGLNVAGWQMLQRIAMTFGLTLFGYYLPAIFVKNVANKRLSSIVPVFPDALDLLLICVESGMSVELAFARVADELAENSVELAEEFSLTTAELWPVVIITLVFGLWQRLLFRRNVMVRR